MFRGEAIIDGDDEHICAEAKRATIGVVRIEVPEDPAAPMKVDEDGKGFCCVRRFVYANRRAADIRGYGLIFDKASGGRSSALLGCKGHKTPSQPERHTLKGKNTELL